MTPRERFLLAMQNRVPDRVPCCPDFSNYIPCRRTGLPFWEIYFQNAVPLWRAYLSAADYFGTEAWIAASAGVPWIAENPRVEVQSTLVFDKAEDAMRRHTLIRTPDGDLTATDLCLRGDPPSPIEKLMKDLPADFRKFRWLKVPPTAIDRGRWDEVKAECDKRQQAFGVGIGYPGFQIWMVFAQGGIEPLAVAEMETPAILEEWYELDLAVGTREMELIIRERPDYILFGGSGTITLASPPLARKYAIPALKKWTRMAKEAGIPTLLHSCGKQRLLADLLADETDLDCVNPLEVAPMGDVDLAELKAARGRRLALMGNLHTTEVMLRGTPDLVRAKAKEAMRDAGVGGGFILSTGDQCARDTPDANLFALVEAAREFGVYDRATGRLPRLAARAGKKRGRKG